MPREISAGAVVVRRTRDRDEFLLLHYTLGHWDFPKGNIEPGESEVETVRREIREETGISRLRLHAGFRETVKYWYRWRGKGIFKIVLYYLAETRQRKIVLSYEHQGAEWLDAGSALKRLTFANSRRVLQKAVRHLKALPRQRPGRKH